MKLISGSSNPKLAQNIALQLGIKQLPVEISTFANGEKRVWIQETVRGENVILVQSLSNPTDEHIMETLLIVDALERQGARHINLVIPWMGYSFQDKVFRPGEPIAAKVVANLISHSRIKRVFLLDLHNSSTPGFFSIPSHHLTAQQLFSAYVKESIGLENTVIASPDFGGLKRSRTFATELGLELINIDKHRNLETGEVSAMGLSGEVANKQVIILDDAILSGGTVVESAKILKGEGAAGVYFLATHGIFTAGALEKLVAAPLNQVVITNSIAHSKLPETLVQLDCAPIFVEELRGWL